MGISCRRDTTFPKDVTIGGVESGRDCREFNDYGEAGHLPFLLTDYEFGSKFCCNRHDNLLESVDVIRIGCATLRPGDIHRT
jgi:hypothetical protein